MLLISVCDTSLRNFCEIGVPAIYMYDVRQYDVRQYDATYRKYIFFYVFLTVHLDIFFSLINQLDTRNIGGWLINEINYIK